MAGGVEPTKPLSGNAREKLAASSAKWNAMPDLVMHTILSKLGLRDQKNCRLVSRHWYLQIMEAIKAVQLSELHISTLEEKFPCLVRISFLETKDLRDSHLQALASSKLLIQELQIGEDIAGIDTAYLPKRYKTSIPDTGMEAIASMITLKKVTLRGDCCLTNAGIQKLGSLTRLEELKLIGCSGFAEKGLGFARELPKLNSLTVVECYQASLGLQVGNELWEEMGPMPHLKHLHLGSRGRGSLELTRERLENLWNTKESHPEELTLSHVHIIAKSLETVARYKSLKALGIAACLQVTMAMALNMLRNMSQLERLNLSVRTVFTDSGLIFLSKCLPHLQHLQVQLGPKTTSNGIRALAGLPDLRACSFECYDISTKALKTISSLKDLTCVELQGDAVPSPLLSDLRHMTNLQGLSLKESSYCSESDKLSPGIIESLSGCLSLRSLDLSYTDIPIKVVKDLLGELKSRDEVRKLDRPVLEHLYLHSCKFTDEDLRSLSSTLPTVWIHQKLPFISYSSTRIGISGSASMT